MTHARARTRTATRRDRIGWGWGWGFYLGLAVMAMATVGGVPAKAPAISGELQRRRRGYDGDRDGEAKAEV